MNQLNHTIIQINNEKFHYLLMADKRSTNTGYLLNLLFHVQNDSFSFYDHSCRILPPFPFG